jgi:hypothetical protein
VVRSSDSTRNGGLLLVVGQALPCEIGAATLGDLKDDRRLDVTTPGSDMSGKTLQRDTDRAASSAALAVEDDVTFCSG